MSWVVASFLVLGAALVAGFAWYERTHPSSRVLALVAALAALAALGRIAFAPLPNVKPTTDIVLLAGYALGGAPGFAVGAVAAIASNLFFGQGPWTPWQMAAWGGVGVGGAVLGRLTGRRLGRVPLAGACALAGLAFGAVMNAHLWVMYSGTHTPAQFAAISAASLPYDLAHAIGNALFCLAFGPALARALTRYRTRFAITWRPVAAAGAAGAVLVVTLAAAPSPAEAADTTRPAGYLVRAQNADGGWGAAPGQRSNPLMTGWAVLGLEAAGRHPAGVARSRTALAYLRAHARDGGDLGSLQRTILALSAAGRPPRDLVARLAARQARDGAFERRVNTTAFAVLALRAAGRPASGRTVRAAAGWLAAQANADGGFNFAGRGGASGIDDTGAALQALAAAGRRGTRAVRRAARFLAARQNPDGGFPLSPGGTSNAQSTAWAVQGLLAAGRNPARLRRGGRDPLGYLRSLIAPSGEVRYSRVSRQTPVWVTGQVLMALARQPLPLRPVRAPTRAAAARPAATAVPTPSAAPAVTATPAAKPARPRRRPARRLARPAPRLRSGAAVAADPATRAVARVLLRGLAHPRRAGAIAALPALALR